MRAVRRGTRVKLIFTDDPWTKLVPGTLGTVDFVDDAATVHVRWDDGSTLGMIAEAGDRYEVVS